jgi:phospholipase A1/A2
VKRAVFAILLLLASSGISFSQPQPVEWVLASRDGRAAAGDRFSVLVISLAGAPLPDELVARLKAGAIEQPITLKAEGPEHNGRRSYSALMPAKVTGAATLDLAERSSSVLGLLVTALDEPLPVLGDRRAPGVPEPPISENDPMYFIVGSRQGYSARFQLSFKYRLFDQTAGFGQDQPWLAGFYFGYTQTSLWELSEQSKPFRDTSYRPSLFWKWERTDDKTWIDAVRAGVEHESNGGGPTTSRSVNTVFVRPEWRWTYADDSRLEFTPKLYAYFDKNDNPDIYRYRGYVDWRARYDSGLNWIGTAVARYGSAQKGSMLIDMSRRIRDVRFGPVGGYLHFQYFNGYGEDILDYNLRRKWQFRVGFAIVP